MLKELFPNLPWDDAGKLMVLPIALAGLIGLIGSGLVYLGDSAGLAYGERLNPKAPDCKKRPRLEMCVNPYTGEAIKWVGDNIVE